MKRVGCSVVTPGLLRRTGSALEAQTHQERSTSIHWPETPQVHEDDLALEGAFPRNRRNREAGPAEEPDDVPCHWLSVVDIQERQFHVHDPHSAQVSSETTEGGQLGALEIDPKQLRRRNRLRIDQAIEMAVPLAKIQ